MPLEESTIASINRLLQDVSGIAKRSEEIIRLKREKYNIFTLLRKEHDEEHLHSAFIADLLDPQGMHEMGSIFGEAFFERFKDCDFKYSEKTRVEVEKILPRKLGRADIYLEDGDQEAIIENKIWAVDQPQQLSRYYTHLTNSGCRNPLLIYLTPYQKDASPESTQNAQGDEMVGGNYSRLSYQNEIVDWLKRCKQLAVNHAPLRETIGQYLNLVKKLTGQLTNDEMEKELKDAIRQHFSAAELVHSYYKEVKREEASSFFEGVVSRLKHRLSPGWSVDFENKTIDVLFDKSYGKIILKHSSGLEGYPIVIEGQSTVLTGRTIYGIYGSEDQLGEAALQKISQLGFMDANRKSNKYWLAYDHLVALNDPTVFHSLTIPAERSKLVERTVEKVATLCEAYGEAFTLN